jgi:hypothetical protein
MTVGENAQVSGVCGGGRMRRRLRSKSRSARLLQLRPGMALLATKMVLQNRASFEAQSVSVAVGTSGGKVAPGGVGFGSDKGSASSVTSAAHALTRTGFVGWGMSAV